MRYARWIAGLGLAVCLPLTDAAAQWKKSILPVLGSAPETGMQFGIAVLAARQATDSLGTRPTIVIANAVRTAKAQSRILFDLDRWSRGNVSRVQVNAVAQEFPLATYGDGADSPESGERLYTPRTIDVALGVQRKIADAKWISIAVRNIHTSIVRYDTLVFAPMFDFGDVIPWAAGTHRIVTLGLISDRRDNLLAPSRGHFVEFTTGDAYKALGSDFSYHRTKIDARLYRGAFGGVLGAQMVITDVTGGAPFDQLSIVGNNTTMRGYTMGRFRDRALATTQLEYRTPIRGRWGAALFGGVTVLGSSFSKLGSSRALPSIGGGVRFRLDPVTRSTVRVDYARGVSGQGGLYVAFNEAF